MSSFEVFPVQFFFRHGERRETADDGREDDSEDEVLVACIVFE